MNLTGRVVQTCLPARKVAKAIDAASVTPEHRSGDDRLGVAVKSVAVILLAVVVGGASCYVAAQLIANASANGRLEAVESSLSPASDWVLEEKSRHPASLLCFGIDNPCPSSTTVYRVGSLTPETLAAVAPEAGLTVTGDCRPKDNVAGESTACTGTGSQNGFTVIASAVALSGNRMRVSVSITP